ncbi:MAG: spore protease YyaC [Bacillota bacterium]|jgi:putative sporulation protein YyaC
MNSTEARSEKKLEEYVLHVDDPSCSRSLALMVRQMVERLRSSQQEIVLLCIGTDRCTGDALGPLIGSQLIAQQLPGIHIYGTLEKPVHATNLEENMARIRNRHGTPLLVAIDACLGRMDSVGNIMVGHGPLKPGAGVNKQLPAVGDMYITGVVNVGGFMDYFVLQNTRLYLITRLAQAIAEGLANGLSSLHHIPVEAVSALT